MSRSGKFQLGLVIVSVALWGGVLGYEFVAEPGDPPGFLDDRSFPTAAERVCSAAMARVEAFGNAAAVDTMDQRAELVGRQDEVFTAMVADLRELPRPVGEQGEWVVEWLGDWETHIADRQAWAEQLHRGEDPPFVETAKGNDQISEAVDGFAVANDMPSCATLNDV